MTIATAVEQYMQLNGFTRDEYTAKTVPVKVGPLVIRLPYGPARQRAIAQHDVHHVLTGYHTDLAGEAEIGAFELRAGCTSFFLWMINLAAVVAGLFIAPRRVLRAFRAARGAKTLYALELAAKDVETIEVDTLRDLAGIPRGGYVA